MDEIKEKEILFENINFDNYKTNREVTDIIKKSFKRCSIDTAKIILEEIQFGKIKISVNKLIKSFYQYNQGKCGQENNEYFIKSEEIFELRKKILNCIRKMDRVSDEEEIIEGKEIIEGEEIEVRKIQGGVSYQKFLEDVGEYGEINYKYDFNKPDIEFKKLTNMNVLQLTNILIMTKGIKFDYPVEYIYKCPTCTTTTTEKVYKVTSTKNTILCPGMIVDLRDKEKRCNIKLYPADFVGQTVDGYYYEIQYENDKENLVPASAIGFKDYVPGFYKCAVFKIKVPNKTEAYHIVDVEPITKNNIEFPALNRNENYVLTLVTYFDNLIKEKTGLYIQDLLPMKVSMILQAVVNHLDVNNNMNISIVGSPSTGKTTISKYYGYLLYGPGFLLTDAHSISVPALRGTRVVKNLFGKDIKLTQQGLLSCYKLIHIDEAGQNHILITDLKSFLAEDTFSNNMAGSDGIMNKRTAHVNITENISSDHLGKYRNRIRKLYKDTDLTIEGIEKPKWDESWDLHQPIYTYNDNLYLRKAITAERRDLGESQVWWIDGKDSALHQRFPFYYFLVNEKSPGRLKEVTKYIATKHEISSGIDLINILYISNIEQFFDSLQEYIHIEDEEKGLDKVDEILDGYKITPDPRYRIFYYKVVRYSRIINKRKEFTEQDYDLLKYFIEKIDCKLDVDDTSTITIQGPPDAKKNTEIELKIEDLTKKSGDEFGLQSGEFE